MYDAGGCGQLTRFEHYGKVVGLVECEVTADARTTAGYLAVHVRRRIDVIVEHYGDVIAGVLFGETRPCLGSHGVHDHGHLCGGTVVLRIFGAGVDYGRAVEGCLLLLGVGLDGIKLIYDICAFQGFYRPHELEVAWQHGAYVVTVQHGVDL